MINKVAVIGGDMRHLMLAQLLSQSGYNVSIYGMNNDTVHSLDLIERLDELPQFDSVILPMPVTQDGIHINAPAVNFGIGLDDVMDSVSCGTIVLGGKLPVDLVEKYKQLSFYDYLEREDFAIKNSVATAEGALALAINETPRTIWKSRCLVTGFGRISKTLVRMLLSLGASVDVCARKCSDRAWCETLSCGAFDICGLTNRIKNYDLIFNTIPSTIINYDILKNVDKNALIIDLASKPGGADFLLAGV